MKDKEPAPSPKNNSYLENITTLIEVHKFGKPILNLDELGYLSIRNPAAFIYNNQIGLLYTVRTSPKNSELHLAWSKNGENFELNQKPFIGLDKDSLTATEDARITKIKDEFWVTFTSYKRKEKGKHVLRVGKVITKNFKEYYNREIILDEKQENKNTLIFENNGKYFIIDRNFMKKRNEKPKAQIAQIKKLFPFTTEEFQDFLLPRKKTWDNARVGINTPPIKIKHDKYGDCLFMLYHGADKKTNTYKIGYIITDRKNPLKILERSKEPLIKPELDFEIGKGIYSPEVPNVIFGCGTIPIDKHKIRFYYSGADKYPSFADLKLKGVEIVDEIFKPKTS